MNKCLVRGFFKGIANFRLQDQLNLMSERIENQKTTYRSPFPNATTLLKAELSDLTSVLDDVRKQKWQWTDESMNGGE